MAPPARPEHSVEAMRARQEVCLWRMRSKWRKEAREQKQRCMLVSSESLPRPAWPTANSPVYACLLEIRTVSRVPVVTQFARGTATLGCASRSNTVFAHRQECLCHENLFQSQTECPHVCSLRQNQRSPRQLPHALITPHERGESSRAACVIPTRKSDAQCKPWGCLSTQIGDLGNRFLDAKPALFGYERFRPKWPERKARQGAKYADSQARARFRARCESGQSRRPPEFHARSRSRPARQ